MNEWVLLVLSMMIITLFFFLYRIRRSSNKNKAIEENPQFKKGPKQKNNIREWPIIESTQEEVVKAIRIFSDTLPKGVSRTILVNEDHSIDFEPLAHILKGIPSKPFYMSKETYDIFAEAEKNIPPILDKVQKAIDHYVEEKKQYPVLDYDPLKRVNYFQLIKGHYLQEKPEIDLYLTEYDGLISHRKPKKEKDGGT